MELLKQFKQKENIMESSPDKYINGLGELTKLNEKAVKAKYNRSLYINKLIDAICFTKKKSAKELWDIKMPITFSMIHNDTEVRVVFSWGNGSSQLDMSFEDYAALPKITDVK
jgi:hypothetical protein